MQWTWNWMKDKLEKFVQLFSHQNPENLFQQRNRRISPIPLDKSIFPRSSINLRVNSTTFYCRFIEIGCQCDGICDSSRLLRNGKLKTWNWKKGKVFFIEKKNNIKLKSFFIHHSKCLFIITPPLWSSSECEEISIFHLEHEKLTNRRKMK